MIRLRVLHLLPTPIPDVYEDLGEWVFREPPTTGDIVSLRNTGERATTYHHHWKVLHVEHEGVTPDALRNRGQELPKQPIIVVTAPDVSAG